MQNNAENVKTKLVSQASSKLYCKNLRNCSNMASLKFCLKATDSDD